MSLLRARKDRIVSKLSSPCPAPNADSCGGGRQSTSESETGFGRGRVVQFEPLGLRRRGRLQLDSQSPSSGQQKLCAKAYRGTCILKFTKDLHSLILVFFLINFFGNVDFYVCPNLLRRIGYFES